MPRATWMKRAIGEISKLRQNLFGTFGRILSGHWNAPYVLGSSKVDYKLARELYFNTRNEYKLGAGFAKPTINTLAGFRVPFGLHEEARRHFTSNRPTTVHVSPPSYDGEIVMLVLRTTTYIREETG